LIILACEFLISHAAGRPTSALLRHSITNSCSPMRKGNTRALLDPIASESGSAERMGLAICACRELSRDRSTVRRFYDEALKAGWRDNGAPGGARPMYSPGYYGALCWIRTDTISKRSVSPGANETSNCAEVPVQKAGRRTCRRITSRYPLFTPERLKAMSIRHLIRGLRVTPNEN
jgi:hypothetical protein